MEEEESKTAQVLDVLSPDAPAFRDAALAFGYLRALEEAYSCAEALGWTTEAETLRLVIERSEER